MSKTAVWIAGPGLLALILASSHAAAHAPTEAPVEVRTFAFAPDTLRVEAGSRVRWTNRDAIAHTVTWDTPDDSARSPQSAVLDSAGVTHTVTLPDTGRFGYFCDRHRFMRGMVIVTSPGERSND